MTNKGSSVLAVLLAIIIGGVAGYFFFDLTSNETKDNKEVNSNTNLKDANVTSTDNNATNTNNSNVTSTDNNATNTNNSNVTNCNNYTFKDMAGYYTFTEKNNSVPDHDFSFGYNIYLWENGTFKYQYVMNAESSHLGNYTIVGDEIHLNYLFSGGNDAAITSTTGSKVLKIKDNNTLVDENGYFNSQGGSKIINLTRGKRPDDSYNSFKVENIIDTYIIVNHQK